MSEVVNLLTPEESMELVARYAEEIRTDSESTGLAEFNRFDVINNRHDDYLQVLYRFINSEAMTDVDGERLELAEARAYGVVCEECMEGDGEWNESIHDPIGGIGVAIAGTMLGILERGDE